MKHIDIYTDGACKGNPGPGGYGAILVCNEREKELSGGSPHTTNNRMELNAAIAGLEILKESCDVTLYTDSKYLADAVNMGWANNWKKNNWIKGDKQPALNPDLWEKMLGLLYNRGHTVKVVWVKGHAGNKYNERCDRIAVKKAEKYSEEGKNTNEKNTQ